MDQVKLFQSLKCFFNKYYVFIVTFCLLTPAIYFICMVDIAPYDTFKQTYFYKGSCLIILLSLFLRKSDIHKNPGAICAFLIFAGLVANWLYDNRGNWGNELQRLYIYKFLSFDLMILVLFDIIKNGAKVCIPKNKSFLCFTFIVLSLAFILEPNFTLPILCPCLAIYLIPFNRKKWEYFEISFASGVVISFCYIMTKSYIQSFGLFSFGRFAGMSGIAQNGALCGITFVCIIFLIFQNINKYHCKLAYIPLGLSLIYASFFLIIVSSRSCLLGVIVTLTVALSVRYIKNKKTFYIFNSILVAIFALTLVLLYSHYINLVENDQPIPHVLSVFEYLKPYLNPNEPIAPWGDLSPNLRFLNTLDHILSGRLSIWYSGIRSSTLLGKNETGIYLTGIDTYFYHAHCNMIDWIMRYGYIVGLLMNAWFITLIVREFRYFIKTKDFRLFSYILIFCAVFTMFDVQFWDRIVAFSVILLLNSQLGLTEKNENQTQ